MLCAGLLLVYSTQGTNCSIICTPHCFDYLEGLHLGALTLGKQLLQCNRQILLALAFTLKSTHAAELLRKQGSSLRALLLTGAWLCVHSCPGSYNSTLPWGLVHPDCTRPLCALPPAHEALSCLPALCLDRTEPHRMKRATVKLPPTGSATLGAL